MAIFFSDILTIESRRLMDRDSLQSLKNGFDLIFQNSKADLRTEASRGYLGVLWWIFEPMIYMGTFYIVFSHLFKRGDQSFIFFLLTGLVVWKWFNASIIVGSNSLMSNVGLMNQVYVPKMVFPFTVIVVNTVKFLIIFGLFLIFLIIMAKPWISWTLVPCVIITQFVLTVSITCLVSALVPFFPDFHQLLDNIMLVFFFLSGVFLDIAQFPDKVQKLLFLNPMAVLISMYRQVLLEGIAPDWSKLLIINLFSVIVFISACLLLWRFDRTYPKIIH